MRMSTSKNQLAASHIQDASTAEHAHHGQDDNPEISPDIFSGLKPMHEPPKPGTKNVVTRGPCETDHTVTHELPADNGESLDAFKALSLEQMGETTFCFGKAHLGKTFR